MIDFFQKNIGVISPYIKVDVIKWINDVGQPLVLAAMKRALERGKANWGYVKGILQSWLVKGFKTVVEVEREVFACKQKDKKKQQKGSWFSQSRSREVIPDWFHERNKGEVEPDLETESEATERERKEIDELLAAYADG